MTDQTTETQQKSGSGKLSVIIILAIAIIGGAITLFLLFQSSDKQKYFSAEQDTYHFLKEEVEERFADELAWAELAQEKPTESTIDISAEYQDPYAFGGVSEIEEMINNSTISIRTQADMKEKVMFADLQADIAGMTFEDFRFNLTDTLLLVELPFLEEVLQLDSEDLGPLLHEIDPYTFEEDETYDFSPVFNSEDYPIPKEDREYLADKYGKFVYDELPDDAFSSDKEEVDVDGESIKADKISVHLTEDQVKTFVTSLLEEVESDERLREILEAYFEENFIPADELEMLMDDYDESLANMKDDVDNIELPEGIESTIWTDNGLIVQRHLEFSTEDAYGDEFTLAIEGTQLLEEEVQNFDYDINFSDTNLDESVSLVAELSRDDEDMEDSITIGVDGMELTYEGDETLKDSKRDFTRTLSVNSPEISGALVWTGDSEYEKDQMSSNHQLHVEADGIGADLLNVQLGVEGKQVKEVESIDAQNVKDLGKMSESELDQYFEEEAAEQFFEWYMEKFGDVGF